MLCVDVAEVCPWLSIRINLNTIGMNGIETYDWVLDVLNTEEVNMNHDFANDEGDLLDAQRLMFPPLTWVRVSDFSLMGM